MSELDRNTELYSRYVKSLTEQEDEIENLRDSVEELTNKIHQKRDELHSFLLDQ